MGQLEQGRFEGKVIAGLESLTNKLDDLITEQRAFKEDIYLKVNKNTADIAKQKGIWSVISLIFGIMGGAIVEIYKRLI